MKEKIFSLLLIAALGGVVTGCVSTVDGHTEVGVPFGKDSVEGRYERSVKRILEAARVVLKRDGQITADNSVNNSIEGKIDRSTVYIRVDELDPVKPASRVLVEARTHGGGNDLNLAIETEKEIAIELAVHR